MELKQLTEISNKIEKENAHDNNFVLLTYRLNKLLPNAKHYNENNVERSTEQSIMELINSVAEEFDKYWSKYCEGLSKFYIVGSFYLAYLKEKQKIQLINQ